MNTEWLRYIPKVPKLFSHLLKHASKEGDWAFSPIELLIIHQVIDSLDERDRSPALLQLEQAFFKSAWNKGRINVVFPYFLENFPYLDKKRFADRLFSVRLRSEGGRNSRSNVTFFDGRLFSIEFSITSAERNNANWTIESVTEGRPRQSFTRSIDRSEHGGDAST